MEKTITKAVVLTAGQGKRMFPLTAAIPKALLPVGGKPAVQRAAEEAVKSGVKDLCFVVGDDAVKNHFCRVKDAERLFGDVNFEFRVQNEPKGSGDALLCAKDFCDGKPFFALNCDDLFADDVCGDMLKSFAGSGVVAVKSASRSVCGRFGVAFTYPDGKLKYIEEKPPINKVPRYPQVLVGRYIFDGDIFYALKDARETEGELRLTDGVNILAKQNAVYCSFVLGERFDVGNKEDYFKAFKFFAENDFPS